jgi:hypothetical protein
MNETVFTQHASLIKHVTEGKIARRIEVTAWRRRRRAQLLDLKETRGYWKLKEEALDRTLWRTRFGRGYGPIVKQTTDRMNIKGSHRTRIRGRSLEGVRNPTKNLTHDVHKTNFETWTYGIRTTVLRTVPRHSARQLRYMKLPNICS